MMKAGDIVTIMHDCVTHGGNVIHEAGDKVTILGVETEKGHYSRLCPDIWIPEVITSVLLVGFQGYYQPDSFYEYHIGKKVSKTSISEKLRKPYKPKKFKSGLLVNTVKGVINHPELDIPAYTFEEDDSYVECRRCEFLNPTEVKELTK